jgi:hypothetical protein
MKSDLSKYLHDVYPKLNNKLVRFTLKDGQELNGVITGFFYNNKKNMHQLIYSWQVTPKDNKINFASDPFGYANGKMILHKNVVEIFFFDNNNKVTF